MGNKKVIIKNVLINLILSFFITTVVVAILFLTHIIDKVWVLLKKIRGTSDYEGESKGLENLNITIGIIIPALLLMSFTIVVIIRSKRKNKYSNQS